MFIRFSGCNLSCPFCDTKHDKGIFMDDDAIIHAVKLYKADWIVLTGGEPALSIDADFIHLLRRATGKKIAIETNGTVPLPDGIDWITCSPKTGICRPGGLKPGEEPSNPDFANVVIPYANEIKVVDVGQDLDPYFSLKCKGEDTIMYLQPCYVPDEEEFAKNRLRTVRRVLADPRWTLSVQLHRFLGIP